MMEIHHRVSMIILFAISSKSVLASSYHHSLSVTSPDADEPTFPLIDIINECFIETKTIIIVADREETLIRKAPAFNFFPSVIKVTHLNSSENRLSYLLSPTLLLITSSLENLNGLLTNLKTDQALWDIHQPTIITNENPSDSNSCNGASDFLFTAWTFELLSAFYFCIDEMKGPKLFTYNPYTFEAPNPWLIINDIKIGARDWPWTLLEHSSYNYYYSQSKKENLLSFASSEMKKSICNSLVFDKTSDFSGYPAIARFYEDEPRIFVKEMKNGIRLILGVDAGINMLALSEISLTLSIDIIDKEAMKKILYGNTGVAADEELLFKDIDLFMNILPFPDNKEWTNSLLCLPMDFTIISQKHYFSSFELLLQSPIRLYLFFLIVGAFIILFYYLKFKKPINFIVILKIILGLSLDNLPKKFPTRILIFSLMTFFFILNSIYPGDLVSSLTVSKTHRNIENKEDINELNYELLTEPLAHQILHLDYVEKLNLSGNSQYCYEGKAKINQACIVSDLAAQVFIQTSPGEMYKYHLPKKPIFSISGSYLHRRNWPPSRRLNNMYLIIAQSGLVEFWERNGRKQYLSNTLINDGSAKPLNFHDTIPAFFFLVTGLTLSLIVFLGELVTNWKLTLSNR